MHNFKRLVFLAALAMPLAAQAQQAPEVSDNVADIVADASMAPDVRIKRSMALLQERSRVLRDQGDSEAADQLQRCITYLLQAPPEAEAAELAAQSVEAATAGEIAAALVLAESAATLAGALPESVGDPVLE